MNKPLFIIILIVIVIGHITETSLFQVVFHKCISIGGMVMSLQPIVTYIYKHIKR